jgi:UDP-N-acetylmuramate--alanine ligase
MTIGQSYEEIAAVHASKPIDWIVVTSALKLDHPHYKFAKDNGIKISKRHDLINLILKEKNLKLIAVAGTHGKTTTTAMIVWLFKQLNLPVSYSIGSNISFGPSAQYQEGSEYFVYEADEFDRNFLNFKPYISLITTIDYDHPDTYPTEGSYFKAFAEFLAQTESTILISNQNLTKLNGLAGVEVKLQGTLYRAKIAGMPRLKIYNPSENSSNTAKYLEQIKLAGDHNRKNAFFAISCLMAVSKQKIDTLYSAIATFPGTQRRFEKLAENLYSDYAHHPTEIAATLELAKEVQDNSDRQPATNNSQLITIYQPHQNIRQHEKLVQEGYVHCFDLADKVYWLPTYLSRENPDLEVLSPEFLSGFVTKQDSVVVAELNHELAQKVKKHLEKGDLVVVMGAGAVDEWARNIVR